MKKGILVVVPAADADDGCRADQYPREVFAAGEQVCQPTNCVPEAELQGGVSEFVFYSIKIISKKQAPFGCFCNQMGRFYNFFIEKRFLLKSMMPSFFIFESSLEREARSVPRYKAMLALSKGMKKSADDDLA